MSADNGVYILVTPLLTEAPNGELVEIATEYRVANLQAVENYVWDAAYGAETDDPDVHIANARKMWARAKVFYERIDALVEADRLTREYPMLEYGISFIQIPRAF